MRHCKDLNSHSTQRSSSLTADSAGELQVLGHDGDTSGVDGSEVGVFEKTDEVSLGGLLKGEDSRGLESEISLELRSDLSNESLEGELSNEELGALLEAADLTESDGAGSESVGLFNATSIAASCFLSGNLDGNSLSGSLATGVLASSLLCSCHFNNL